MALLKNPHPGEILKEEFITPLNISQNHVADALGIPRNRIHLIISGARSVTADTDLRLCKYFGLSEGFFLRLQITYDLMEAKRAIGKQIAKIKPFRIIEHKAEA